MQNQIINCLSTLFSTFGLFIYIMWFYLALTSALFLGFYDIFKKTSVQNNAVLPVLLLSTTTSAAIFIPIILFSKFNYWDKEFILYTPNIPIETHLLVFIKATIVLLSWIFSFFALKHLPITFVSPIRATGPMWTLMGAIVIFKEQLNTFQWIGIATTLSFFWLFSTTGKLEGIHIRKNKWVWFIILGTLIGAISGLYDKFLIRNINRMAVQAWFSIYQALIMIPIILFIWWPQRKSSTPFTWRWSIPLIGIFLVIADFAYFYALTHPESMISIISALRRGSVVIAFGVGAILFKEKNIQKKSLYLLGILTGIAILIYGSH